MIQASGSAKQPIKRIEREFTVVSNQKTEMTRKEKLDSESSSDAANEKVNKFDFINSKIKRMTSINEPAEENAAIVYHPSNWLWSQRQETRHNPQ